MGLLRVALVIMVATVAVSGLWAQQLTVPVARIVQSTGAVLKSAPASGAVTMYAISGLTSIGPMGGPDTSLAYLGFWHPLIIVLSVDDDGGSKPDPGSDSDPTSGDDFLAGPRVYAWPNPFPSDITFRIPRGGAAFESITAQVYSMDGRLVAYLMPRVATQDYFELYWDGQGIDEQIPVAAGSYTVRFIAESDGAKKRMAFSTTIVCVR